MKNIELLKNIADENNLELDYLTDGSPIFQDKNLYTFTSDSVVLARFVDEDKIERLVDFCSGSGELRILRHPEVTPTDLEVMVTITISKYRDQYRVKPLAV